MREAGRTPTLMLLPISWQLRESIGLPPIGSDPALSANPLVPPQRVREFAGQFEGVPVLDMPQVSAQLMWIVDLPALARFREWASERDSGVKLDLESFDKEKASEFLDKNPSVADG